MARHSLHCLTDEEPFHGDQLFISTQCAPCEHHPEVPYFPDDFSPSQNNSESPGNLTSDEHRYACTSLVDHAHTSPDKEKCDASAAKSSLFGSPFYPDNYSYSQAGYDFQRLNYSASSPSLFGGSGSVLLTDEANDDQACGSPAALFVPSNEDVNSSSQQCHGDHAEHVAFNHLHSTSSVAFAGLDSHPNARHVDGTRDMKPALHRSNKRKRVKFEDRVDPENRAIKFLRTKRLMSWSEIASTMNKSRRQHGGKETFTEAAVYGRFVRNAPRIAIVDGEGTLDPSDWMHMPKSKRNVVSGTITDVSSYTRTIPSDNQGQWSFEDDRLLRQVCHRVFDTPWVVVAEMLTISTGRSYAPKGCANRYSMVR